MELLNLFIVNQNQRKPLGTKEATKAMELYRAELLSVELECSRNVILVHTCTIYTLED